MDERDIQYNLNYRQRDYQTSAQHARLANEIEPRRKPKRQSSSTWLAMLLMVIRRGQ